MIKYLLKKRSFTIFLISQMSFTDCPLQKVHFVEYLNVKITNLQNQHQVWLGWSPLAGAVK